MSPASEQLSDACVALRIARGICWWGGWSSRFFAWPTPDPSGQVGDTCAECVCRSAEDGEWDGLGWKRCGSTVEFWLSGSNSSEVAQLFLWGRLSQWWAVWEQELVQKDCLSRLILPSSLEKMGSRNIPLFLIQIIFLCWNVRALLCDWKDKECLRSQEVSLQLCTAGMKQAPTSA